MAPLPRTRDRSRTHDIVLFGATGFTGGLVAEYLAKKHRGARIALAGRDREKLARVQDELAKIDPGAARWPIRIADARDRGALAAIAKEAEVVCTAIGPYAKYGADLVAACVQSGTDYCDLTGEAQFIAKTIEAHHAEAVRTGARIVHCTGFDSIPSDLGTLMMHRAMSEAGGRLEEVRFFMGKSSGGASGGTVASALHLLDEARSDPAIRKVLADPYSLVPSDARGPDTQDMKSLGRDRDLGTWTAPFLMAAINAKIVRRTNYLLDFPYGRDFRYSERMSTGKGIGGLARAAAITGATAAIAISAGIGPIRRLAEKRLPKPGEGPDREARERGYFAVHLIATGRGKNGGPRMLRGRIQGEGDPGYGETAKMMAESALCLALDGASLSAPGGIRTPASTMGPLLIDRLRAAGMVFSVE